MARSNYDPNVHPAWAWSLTAIEGLTDKEIADRMGVSRTTLNTWRKKYEEFDEAIRDGKAPVDARVEQSLLKRAVGYTYKERKLINVIDRDGKPQPARIETFERHMPPDTTAQIYWLKNRRRDKWKDKWDVEIEGDREITFNILAASQKNEEEEK